MMVLFIIILVRSALMQLTNIYRKQSIDMKQKHIIEKRIEPVRGEIYDRNMVLMSTSIPFYSAVMDCFQVNQLSYDRKNEMFKLLNKLLGIDFSDLHKIVQENKAIVQIKRDIDFQEVAMLNALIQKGSLYGIQCIIEQVRKYPWGVSSKALLGNVRGSQDILRDFIKNNKGIGYHELCRLFPWYPYSSICDATPQRGIGGIEQSFNSYLKGSPYRFEFHLDRNRKPMNRFTRLIQEGISPGTVILTIDADLQQFIAKLLSHNLREKKAFIAMALVMEAASGEVLAAYSCSRAGDQTVLNDSLIFTSSFEPGSVVKPLVVLRALENGVIKKTDRFDCNRPFRIGNKTYLDEHPYLSSLSIREILSRSSDSGIAQIVKKMMDKEGIGFKNNFYRFYKKVGLGSPLPLEHTAIPQSRLPSPGRWSAITPSQLSIGYEFKASAFHLVRLYAGFANGGKLVHPTLIKGLIDSDGKFRSHSKTEPIKKIGYNPANVLLINEYLKDVVSATSGTGGQAAIENFEIAGKTGTARRLVNGKYSTRSHNSTFIGILPLKGKYRVIGVFFQDIKTGSDYGGTACAPIFKKIASYMIQRNSP